MERGRFLLLCGSLLLWGAAAPVFAGSEDGRIVTLQMVADRENGCGPMKTEFVEVSPDGGRSSQPFRVPSGSVLTITDIEWYYVNGAAVNTIAMKIVLENLADASKRSTVLQSIVRLDGQGRGGESRMLRTGFEVGETARVCAELSVPPLSDASKLTYAILRGRLR